MSEPIRVLYAEDNPQDADQTREHFATHAPDFDLEIVPTAERFLARAAEQPFDLLLLDNRLPDQDGVDVLKYLMRAAAHPPVVLITGVGDNELVVQALRLGADDYVAKRFDYLTDLPGVLRAVLAESRRGAQRHPVFASNARRILYVEHNPADVDLTLRHFAQTAPRVTVQISQSAEHALALLSGPHEFDLVLCDLHMGGMSALDLLHELKRLPQRPPFVVITGHGDEQTAIAALKLGACDYLIKREGYLNQLPIIIENAVDHAQLEQAHARLAAELAAAALRESEDRYRLLVERSLDAILVYCNDRIVFANPSALKLFGASGPEQLLGRSYWERVAPECHDFVRQRILAALEGTINPTREVKLVRLDGTVVAAEAASNPFTHEGGPAAQVVLRDITERLNSERLARRSQRLEAIGTLASGVAHDLSNALAPIMMGVEVMRGRYPNESQILEIFELSAKHSVDMVRQLLTFAKGAEGEQVSIQLTHLFNELHKIIQRTFPKNIQLTVKCDKDLPTVRGDATQLNQVLLNLCVNARDAMPHSGTLTLEAERCTVDAAYASSIPDARPGEYVVLRVRDTGTGIPPDLLERIFDPFFTTKGPDKGTGLGLSTVLGIVKGHGGFIQVYSQPGRGSIFAVYLPVEGAAGDTTVVAKAEVEFRGRGETILFVDDEPAVREMARTVLQRLNFKPLTATDGADGLIQAVEHRTELRAVITDVHMPHMDGLALVRALRRALSDIPVIVTSGWMENAVAEEFQTLGVTTRLDKPFTEGELAEALKRVLAPQ